MIELVTEAQSQRSPSERFSQWFGQRYTIFVLVGSAVALGVFLLVGLPRDLAFYKAATLLVVASPCSIVISVPAAVLSALAAAARMGVLFKGGAALEDFGATKVVAFDKTGTLTEGRMRVTDVVGITRSEADVLAIAASIEQTSEHPVARSILERADADGISLRAVNDVQAVPGKGIRVAMNGEGYWAGNRRMASEVGAEITGEAEHAIAALEQQGRTAILVGNGGVLGAVGVADTVRASARDTLADLARAGVRSVAMLTGDHAAVANNVGRALGIDEKGVFADLLPEDKVERIRLLNEHGRVTFVGDGVNDAAALATASVGVAMGTAGSDVALEAADVALLSDDLRKLPQAYRLARRANRIIRQNLAFALGIMLLMVIVTLLFYLPLPLGVLGHEGGTILVVANGLRLLAFRPADEGQRAAPARSGSGEMATGD
jgi:heavy metal translocating P-type ATPase